MRKLIIGTLSLGIGAAALLYSFPSITGNAIAETTKTPLVPIFSFILIACGIALFAMEAIEARKKD